MSLPAIKVLHVTSVHPRNDTRILIKECMTLSEEGLEVSYAVADGLAPEKKGKINVTPLPEIKSRLLRMAFSWVIAFVKLRRLDVDIYHFHDPELILTGLLLHIFGSVVVFDAHEDVPNQILGKPYIPNLLRKPISILFQILERVCLTHFDLIVAATDPIAMRYQSWHHNVTTVRNYPMKNELFIQNDYSTRRHEIVYVGSISVIRGIHQLVDAVEIVREPVTLNLIGTYAPASIRESLVVKNGWLRVCEHGQLARNEVAKILAESRIGVVVFLPSASHLDSYPTKLFEYMSSGLPVIASKFPLWKSIVEDTHCGICVDPLVPSEIAKAISYLLNNPKVAYEMGQNGVLAIQNVYNWETESTSLKYAYSLLKDKVGKKSYCHTTGINN